MDRAECARSASLVASAGQVAGRADRALALVSLPAQAPSDSTTLSSAAPCASGSARASSAAHSHAVARPARAHRRTLGAVASTLASTEAADGPSGNRSSLNRGGDAVGRAHWLILA